MKRPRVLFAGGGSGGHLYPGLAAAAELGRRHGTGVTCLFRATRRAVDRRILGGAGVAWEAAPGFRDGRGGWLRDLAAAPRALAQGAGALRRIRPDVVVGLGGQASLPACLAAVAQRVPLILLEPNCLPGRANRVLAPLASEICLQFSETCGALPRRVRTCVTGVPLRPDLRQVPRGTARLALGLDPSRPTILVLGGSQGASGLNRLMAGAVPHLAAAAPSWQILHLAGAGDRCWVARAYRRGGLPARVRPYLDRMHLAYSAADLVVSRAGAGAVAEVSAFGLPAIFVPYPHDRPRHQAQNAALMVRAGAAMLHSEDRDGGFAGALASLLVDAARRGALARRARRMGHPGAATRVAMRIEHWGRFGRGMPS